eukprot:5787322-Prymnesium_polylepis.2
MSLLIGKPHVVMPTKQNKTKWVREAAFNRFRQCAKTDRLLTTCALTLSDALDKAIGLLCQQSPEHGTCYNQALHLLPLPPANLSPTGNPQPAVARQIAFRDCSAPADRTVSGATTHYTTAAWSGTNMQHWAPRSLHMAKLVGPNVKVLMDLGAGARALEKDIQMMHKLPSLTYIPDCRYLQARRAKDACVRLQQL